VLQIFKLSLAYPGCVVVRDFSTQAANGLVLVQGGGGRGKTSLVRLLAGELAADAGQLQLGSVWLHEQPAAYRQQVFWADPGTAAHDALTAKEYLRQVQHHYPTFDEARLNWAIEGLSLAPHLDKNIFMLSTGSKRKLYLAAAYASGAALTLLDTPFAALDKVSIRFAFRLLAEATQDSTRLWVLADYEQPEGMTLPVLIDLGD
jgi:ABC-type transport system involved in cytochrome c biogenesis ATPase subunit